MFIAPIKYQSVIFLNATDIKPAGKDILRLIKIFSDAGFDAIPSTVTEFGPMGVMQRMKFSSQDGRYDLVVGTQRIDFTINSLQLSKEELGSLDNFVELSRKIFKGLLDEYKIKFFRLALVAQYFSDEVSAQDIYNYFKEIITPPNFNGDEDVPYECVCKIGRRKNYRVAGRTEVFNIISTVSRLTGQLNSIVSSGTFDRISLEMDVNTIPEAMEPRFNVDDWSDFSAQALEIENALKKNYDDLFVQ